MPEFLSVFIDLYIVLARILGIIIAIQGANFLSIPAFRLRVLALFAISFTICAIAASVPVFFNAGLDEEETSIVTSLLAIAVNLAFAPLMLRARNEATQGKQLNTLTIDLGLASICVFPAWFALNILGYWNGPNSVPLAFWFLFIFVVSAVSFVRIALYTAPGTEALLKIAPDEEDAISRPNDSD